MGEILRAGLLDVSDTPIIIRSMPQKPIFAEGMAPSSAKEQQ